MPKMRFCFILPIFLLHFFANGQTDSTRYYVIQGLTQALIQEYVNPNLAKKMTEFINQKFINCGYDSILNKDEFIFEVMNDLRNISKDEHISVRRPNYYNTRIPYYGRPKVQKEKIRHYPFRTWYNVRTIKDEKVIQIKIEKKMHRYDSIKTKRYEQKRDRWRTKYIKRVSRDMFTYGQIKILPGNIGYFEFFDFSNAYYNNKYNKNRIPLRSVLRFLRNTKSIIIDMRRNTGGYVFLSSYFTSHFVEKPNSYFITKQWKNKSYKNINGEFEAYDTIITKDEIMPAQNNFKYTKGKKVYALTSKATFSAAELALYRIKKQLDIEIIGEKTVGGGNGFQGAYVNKFYSAIIPNVKIYDKENNNYSLEAIGITPDSLVNADSAFKVAYSLAIKDSRKSTLRRSPRYFRSRDENKIHYSKLIIHRLPKYVGDYRKIKVSIENERLIFVYDRLPKEILLPGPKDYFKSKYFRYIRFLRNTENKILAIQVRWYWGLTETFNKLDSN